MKSHSRVMLYLTLFVLLLPHTLLASPTEHRVRHRPTAVDDRLTRQNVFDTLPLRPSPMVMVPLPLEESINKDLDPDSDHLDEIKLLNQMGLDFDSHYMSVSAPLEMKTRPKGELEYSFKKGERPRGPMPDDFAMLDSRSIKLSEDGPEIKMRASKKTRRKLQKFLWAYSYCPVRYTWQELSVRFWPRYIKMGACENKRSCSVPAGMTCQPSKLIYVRLLRFYCAVRGSRKSCQWVKIKYPILSECSCSCQPYSNSDDNYT